MSIIGSEGRTDAAVDDAAVGTLRGSFRGPLLRPGDVGYDDTRKVWNGMIDRRPALIARCTGVADVIAAVNFARDGKLLVAIRGGGHNIAGTAVADGSLMIELSLLKGVRVDPVRRTAHAQAGLLWGEFDRETQAFGLATTGGIVTHTGIAGLTLGGGIGWLMRRHGITCDNLLSVDVVTADGRFLTASETENADLFWGIRGAGENFGVVTSFEYRLHAFGPTALAGLVLHPAEKAREVLRFYREYASSLPDELTTILTFRRAPALPVIPERLHGAPVVSIGVCYAGPVESGERVVKPLREFGPPLIDVIGPKPYTAHQSILDTTFPHGLRYYWKSHYLSALPDAAIDAIAARAWSAPSPRSLVGMFQLGGAVARVREDEMAFSGRDASYALNIIGIWEESQESDENIRWCREFWSAMEPFATGGVYLNFIGAEEDGRVKAAYGGAKFERLRALKNKYDPTNFFRLNHNIKPTV